MAPCPPLCVYAGFKTSKIQMRRYVYVGLGNDMLRRSEKGSYRPLKCDARRLLQHMQILFVLPGYRSNLPRDVMVQLRQRSGIPANT